MVPLMIYPEDDDMRRGAGDEEEQQDGADGVVNGDGWAPAQESRGGSIGRPGLG